MTAIIMREKSHVLKGILCNALGIVEEMCEGGEMGERQGSGGYGDRYGYGMREDYPMGERGGGYGYGMREDYPMGERGGYMGERRGRSAMTGRYTRM